MLHVYRVKGVDPFGYTGEASGPVEIRTEATGAAPARPNVVLILADDLGWGDIQSNNPDSAMTTPRIDSIAAAGANFTDAHSSFVHIAQGRAMGCSPGATRGGPG